MKKKEGKNKDLKKMSEEKAKDIVMLENKVREARMLAEEISEIITNSDDVVELEEQERIKDLAGRITNM